MNVRMIQKKDGVVLLLALLMITGVLASAAIFATILLRDIQQTRLLDHSIQAYYLAESGAERALYQTRKLEAIQPFDCGIVADNSECDQDTGYCSGTEVACIVSEQGTLRDYFTSGENWEVAVANEQSTNVVLDIGDSFQIDLFSPYQTVQSSGQVHVESIVVTSPDVSNFILYGQLTNLSSFVGDGINSSCLNEPVIDQGFISGSNGSATIVGLTGSNIHPACSYIFRVSNPLANGGGQSGAFSIALYDAENPTNGEQLPIPSRLEIRSLGQYMNSEQQVVVHTPVRPPLSGLYDFVLFSEAEIVK